MRPEDVRTPEDFQQCSATTLTGCSPRWSTCAAEPDSELLAQIREQVPA
jgi:hypothetical protein